MTNACPYTSGKMATPLTHSCSNDAVTQLSPLSSDSDAMFEGLKIIDACFVRLLLQHAPHTVVNWIWRNEVWCFSF